MITHGCFLEVEGMLQKIQLETNQKKNKQKAMKPFNFDKIVSHNKTGLDILDFSFPRI